ncbi:MAG TPA: c-type cytochrome biogenesis protein CcsB [Terriglobales bacterium]|nr:c-type cytochrome biogenesis protein CcsB [Terriglobales bacterium]
MSRVKVQENTTPAGGSALLIAVGLGIVFLLFVAFLNIVKPATPGAPVQFFTESNLLYVSLILYSGATALYIGFGVTGIDRYVKVASLVTWAGFIATTAAAGHRWYMAGHPPFANIYEMLLSFVWTIVGLTLISEKRFKVRVIGTVTMPIAVVGVVLMQLLPNDVRPLVPALQSTWLHIHVTLAMLSYAACALSFALAMMFLIQDNMKTETFQVATSTFTAAIYAGLLGTRFEKWGGLSVTAYDLQNKEEMFLGPKVRLMVTIPELGWLFVVVLIAVTLPIVLYIWGRVTKDDSKFLLASRAVFVSIALQAVALGAFVLRAREGAYPSLDAEGLFTTSLAASPFVLAGLVSGIFASLLYLMMVWRRRDLERLLPTADVLDMITYKTICIGFPLLTLMIAAGAYWANRTWGSYWSWDPKETWAAITWLVYAGYLHMRVTRGWRGRRAAYFAILGFAVVMFTFFGVTYLLPGLHAYA